MKKFIKDNFLILMTISTIIFFLYKSKYSIISNRPDSMNSYVFYIYGSALFNNILPNLIIVGYILLIIRLIGKFKNVNILLKFKNRKAWVNFIIKRILLITISMILIINISLILIYKIPMINISTITYIYIFLNILNQIIGLYGLSLAVLLIELRLNKIYFSAAIVYFVLLGVRFINLSFKSIYKTYYEFMFFTSSYETYSEVLFTHILSSVSIIFFILFILYIVHEYSERKDYIGI